MPFQSYIIVGGTSEERTKRAIDLRAERGGTVTDTLLIPETGDTGIKIEDVRKTIHYFTRPPYISRVKTAILSGIESASAETQHALLKLLEEPPSFALIVLTAPKKEIFLPTVLSRASLIRLIPSESREWQEMYRSLWELLSHGNGDRLAHASHIGNTKEEAAQWLKNTIYTLRLGMLAAAKQGKNETTNVRTSLRMASRALVTIEGTATNPRLLVENLLLDLPGLPRLDIDK